MPDDSNDSTDTEEKPKSKVRNRIKKKKLATRQWQSVDSTTDSCEDVEDSGWINFSDDNPSQTCDDLSPGTSTCICQRLRPGDASTMKCGVCNLAFLPTTVNGLSLEEIKEKRKSQP